MTRAAAAIALAVACAAIAVAQKETDADRAAALVLHWQQRVYPKFEDARAYLDEENTDRVNALLSQGAVRTIQDHVDAPGVKKTDASADRLAAAMVREAVRQPGGSLIIDGQTIDRALDAVCPLYPFCDR